MKARPVINVARNFKVLQQVLCLSGIDFESQALVGYTELVIVPLITDLREVKLSCKQCSVERVCVNEIIDVHFTYCEPLDDAFNEIGVPCLGKFFIAQSEALKLSDPDSGGGELVIVIPEQVQDLVLAQKTLRIGVEFSLRKPKAGVRFVVPALGFPNQNLMDRGAHLYTIKHDNNARLWFPCVDSFNELCTWRIEVTVDAQHTVVASGELVDCTYTADMHHKTYSFVVSVPTAAPNIGFAIGPFEVHVPRDMQEVTHFCLPGLGALLKYSTATLDKAFEFFEELLSVRYPYSSYKQVFVDQPESDMCCYATLSILSSSLLYSKRVIDQVPVSRTTMANAVAQQFFGCFLSPFSWTESWVAKGLANYLSGLFVQRFFGHNEHMYQISKVLNEVAQYEVCWGGITLWPTGKAAKCADETPNNALLAQTCSPLYYAMLAKKAHLVMRLLEKKLGSKENFCQVLNKLLLVAQNASQQRYAPASWHNTLLSTESFLRCISSVTGQDLNEFVAQWVTSTGHARFAVALQFNRRKSTLEVEVKQDVSQRGTLRYVGPVTVLVQELDGCSKHVIQIDDLITVKDVPCHSKARRQKKKKVMLNSGDEVEIDLANVDPDPPILWVRFDPEMLLIRRVALQQPDFQWTYQLRYEKDIAAQLDALERLPAFGKPESQAAITEIIENERCFYRVRVAACTVLADLANRLAPTWYGPPALLQIFQNMFGANSCPSIPRPNQFSNFQSYFLLKGVVLSMGRLRTTGGLCPADVQQCLLDLLKLNDNRTNKYADDYYRASIVSALSGTVNSATQGIGVVRSFYSAVDSQQSNYEVGRTVSEIFLQLNHEKLVSSYRRVITVACLKALCHLARCDHVKLDRDFLLAYADASQFCDVRIAAIDCLAELGKLPQYADMFECLLDMFDQETDCVYRYTIMLALIRAVPFRSNAECALNTRRLQERLWRYLTVSLSVDSKLRCLVADLFWVMYGLVEVDKSLSVM